MEQIKRIISLILAVLVSISSVVDASALSVSAIAQPLPPFLSSPPIELHPNLGKIEEVFLPRENPSKNPYVFLIQDAHDSLDAQENTRLILRELIEKEGVSLICFEGGSLELDRSFYDFAHERGLNEKVWDILFKQGDIGALERSALETPSSIRFHGIEEEPLYFKNIRTIQNVYALREKHQKLIAGLDETFEKKARKLLTGDAKKIRDLKKSFDEKRLPLFSYASDLSRWAKKLLTLDFSNPVEQKDWPQMVRLEKLSELESDVKKHPGETEKELAAIKKLLSDFVWNPAEHSRARGYLRWYFERAVDRLCTRGVSLDAYPHLKDWIGFQVLQDEIESGALFKELERLESRILEHIRMSKEVRRFFFEERDWTLAKKLFRLELTREEWQDVKHVSLSPRGGEGWGEGETLRALLHAAKSNYEIVEKRDEILTHRTLELLGKVKPKKAVVLTGGFHTQAFTSRLKEKGMGYAVLSPRIQDLSHSRNYAARISFNFSKLESHSSSDQTALPEASSLVSSEAKPIRQFVLGRSRAALAHVKSLNLPASEAASLGTSRAKEVRITYCELEQVLNVDYYYEFIRIRDEDSEREAYERKGVGERGLAARLAYLKRKMAEGEGVYTEVNISSGIGIVDAYYSIILTIYIPSADLKQMQASGNYANLVRRLLKLRKVGQRINGRQGKDGNMAPETQRALERVLENAKKPPKKAEGNGDFTKGSSLGVSRRGIALPGYGNTLDSIWVIARASRGIFGLILAEILPEIHSRLLNQLIEARAGSIGEKQEPAVVISGELAPEALLAEITQGITAVVHYENQSYKQTVERLAREMIRKGKLTELKFKQRGYFVRVPKLEEESFLEDFLKGKSIAFDDGSRRSLDWIKRANGFSSADQVVWLAERPMIDRILEKVKARAGRPLETPEFIQESGTSREVYDLARFGLAAKLFRDPKELEDQGYVRFENRRYVMTLHFIQTVLSDKLFEREVQELLASMA